MRTGSMSYSRGVLVALVACLAISGAYAGRGASMRNLHAAQGPEMIDLQKTYESQMGQLSDMMASVFMAHSAGNLQEFPHLNVSSIVMSAEMTVTTFITQVETYIAGTVGLVTNLPSEIASLPQNISDAAALSNQPDPTQLLNGTYLTQQFEDLINKLENPIALSGGGAVFAYNPCYINNSPTGVGVFPTGVNIAPTVLEVTPEGVNIQPQGLNIQPVLITIFPVGVNVQPQGLNIAPALIAVTPGRVSINPQGGTIGPALISVSAATP